MSKLDQSVINAIIIDSQKTDEEKDDVFEDVSLIDMFINQAPQTPIVPQIPQLQNNRKTLPENPKYRFNKSQITKYVLGLQHAPFSGITKDDIQKVYKRIKIALNVNTQDLDKQYLLAAFAAVKSARDVTSRQRIFESSQLQNPEQFNDFMKSLWLDFQLIPYQEDDIEEIIDNPGTIHFRFYMNNQRFWIFKDHANSQRTFSMNHNHNDHLDQLLNKIPAVKLLCEAVGYKSVTNKDSKRYFPCVIAMLFNNDIKSTLSYPISL